MRLPASQRVPTAVDRRVSNFDQFFLGLPISLYERPASYVASPPRLAERCGRLSAGVSLPARARKTRFRRPLSSKLSGCPFLASLYSPLHVFFRVIFPGAAK